MGGIIIGPILIIFAIIIFIAGLSTRKNERTFQENKIYTEGVIVGYYREDYTKWDTPEVSLNIDGKEKIFKCKSRKMNSKTHPRGTKVKVVYNTKEKFKTLWADVRIDEENYRPYPVETVGIAIMILGAIFIILGIVLFIIGVLSFI